MAQVTRFYVRNPTKTIQVPRASLHARSVIPCVATSRAASAGAAPPSSLIPAHAPDQSAPAVFGRPYSDRSLQVVVTPCCELALPDVISANLSPNAWTHTPAVLLVRLLVSSQETTAFTDLGAARQPTNSVLRLLYGSSFRGCSHSLMFRPPVLLATQIVPTAAFAGQPWLLLPRISRFVTSPSRGYASRPNRATDGVGTFTPLDSQPCRLLPQAGAWEPAER